MGQHLETLVVENEKTVSQLLEEKGLSESNFFVTKQVAGQEAGALMQPGEKIQAGEKVKIIPKVAGGAI